jgi:hypothetical protein
MSRYWLCIVILCGIGLLLGFPMRGDASEPPGWIAPKTEPIPGQSYREERSGRAARKGDDSLTENANPMSVRTRQYRDTVRAPGRDSSKEKIETEEIPLQGTEAASSAATPEISPPPGTSLVYRQTLEKLALPIDLHILERPLDAVFSEVARLAGLRMRVNDRADDIMLSNRRLTGTVRASLEELARLHNMVWFAERDLIDVAKADTSTIKTFQIPGISDVQLRDALQRFGLINADFAVEVDERSATARVFGPPRLVSRIESIISSLRPALSQTVSDGPVEIIRFGQRTGP